MVVTLISNACISEPNVCLKTHAYCKMSLPRSRQFLQLLKNCHQKMGVEEVDICSWFLEMVILHEIYVKRTSNEQHWNTGIKIWHHCACLWKRLWKRLYGRSSLNCRSAITHPSLIHSSRSIQRSKTVQFPKQFSLSSLCFLVDQVLASQIKAEEETLWMKLTPKQVSC